MSAIPVITGVSGGGRWSHYGGPVGATPPTLDGSEWGPCRKQNWFHKSDSPRRALIRTLCPSVRGFLSCHRAPLTSPRSRVGHCVCEVEETQELATEKRITPLQKIFLDSHPHFGNHDLVIALQTTASTTVQSRAVAAGQPKLPYGNHAKCTRRTAVGLGF